MRFFDFLEKYRELIDYKIVEECIFIEYNLLVGGLYGESLYFNK
jgi:hypothetical protein